MLDPLHPVRTSGASEPGGLRGGLLGGVMRKQTVPDGLQLERRVPGGSVPVLERVDGGVLRDPDLQTILQLPRPVSQGPVHLHGRLEGQSLPGEVRHSRTGQGHRHRSLQSRLQGRPLLRKSLSQRLFLTWKVQGHYLRLQAWLHRSRLFHQRLSISMSQCRRTIFYIQIYSTSLLTFNHIHLFLLST